MKMTYQEMLWFFMSEQRQVVLPSLYEEVNKKDIFSKIEVSASIKK